MLLALTMKYDPYIHGVYPTEQKYIELMKYKNFVITEINYMCNTSCITEVYEWINFIDDIPEHNNTLNISIIKSIYTYKDREFAILNHGLEKFQKKYKSYYTKKMNHYKNPHSLLKRQQTGSFPLYKNKYY
jgi:hypothetical protein